MVPPFLYFLYLTLCKTDIALRRTHTAGPQGVLLRKSWLYMQSNPSLRTLAQYRHLVIIDAFLCPWGESPYIFSNLNPLADTPVNPDNGHFFLAPINLTNVNTSSSTFCCNRSCLSECKIILQFTAFQCSQCYNTPDRMICSCQFETILASFKLCREWFGLTL